MFGKFRVFCFVGKLKHAKFNRGKVESFFHFSPLKLDTKNLLLLKALIMHA